MVYGSLLKGLIRQLENSSWEQIMMQGMYKWPSDTADLIPQLQDHVRSRGGEEQSHGTYIWTAGMLAQQQCSTKGLGQEVWSQYLGDHFCTRVHCLPLPGIEELLQPGSMGLGCEEILGSKIHQCQAEGKTL